MIDLHPLPPHSQIVIARTPQVIELQLGYPRGAGDDWGCVITGFVLMCGFIGVPMLWGGMSIIAAIVVMVTFALVATALALLVSSQGLRRQRLVLGESEMFLYPGPLIPSRTSSLWHRILLWKRLLGKRRFLADAAEVRIKRERLLEIMIEEDEANSEGSGWITLRHRQGSIELASDMSRGDRNWLYDLLVAWMAG